MRHPIYFGASKELILFARKLRINMTQAEKILWEHIRKKSLGHKFRNQHALYKYVVDFFCYELLLIIEVDGSIHTLTEIALNDKDREDNLKSLGLHILRFTNDQIFHDMENVLQTIRKTLDHLEKSTIDIQSQNPPLGI